MSFFKKVGQKYGKTKKVGSRLVNKAKLGLKKGGNVVSMVGAYTGQPEIVSLGEGLSRTGRTIEKN